MLHQTMDSSVSLTGGHVVQLYLTELENGSSLIMVEWFQHKEVLQHSTETEVMMEQST